MVSLSKPLTKVHLSAYFEGEYRKDNYFSQSGEVVGRWHGKLRETLGLPELVDQTTFEMLAAGRDPNTWEQLIGYRRQIKQKRPEWATDDGKWREYLEAQYIAAVEAGKKPFGDVEADGYKLADATRWMVDKLASTHPNLRFELAEQIAEQFGLPKPEMPSGKKQQEHIAGWDMVFGSPKSVSLTALVGGDERVRIAHRLSVERTLAYTERYIQARKGGSAPPETTGRAIWATFEHDTSRPVDGYASPHLHTHCILFNLTEDSTGQARSLQSWEIFQIQVLLTRVYQAELAHELRSIGYKLERGKGGAPEIAGYTREYLDAESPRRKGIEARLEALGLSSARAAEIVAHQGREAKLQLKPSEVKALHLAHAREYGDQPDQIVRLAKTLEKAVEDRGEYGNHTGRIIRQDSENTSGGMARGFTGGGSPNCERTIAAGRSSRRDDGHPGTNLQQRAVSISRANADRDSLGETQQAVTFSRRHLSERESVFEHHQLVANALRYGFGHYRVHDVEQEVANRLERGEIVKVDHVRPHAPGARYATAKMLQMEREVIGWALQKGGGRSVVQSVDMTRYPVLMDNPQRQKVIAGILESTERTVILQGSAGVGKSTSLSIVAELAHKEGYSVVGLAPTGKAVETLRGIGLTAETMQAHLNRQRPSTKDCFYVIDEASLVSTRQMHRFYQQVKLTDRVLLIGDDSPKKAVGQHTSVEAGRIFHQLQDAGVKTAYLNKIMRQKDPELLHTVKLLRNGHTKEAVELLDKGGHVVEWEGRKLRLRMMAESYAEQPERALAIAPDNATKRELSSEIHNTMKRNALVGEEQDAVILDSRDLTQADRTLASSYKVYDHVRYLSGSKEHGVNAKDYVRVIDVDEARNQLTVQTKDGRQITYDPRRELSNCSVFEERTIALSVGDRIQFTSPYRAKGLHTREAGTVQEFDGREIMIKLDNGKSARWDLAQFRHLDYGYVSTSHAAQSLTVDRCLVHVESGNSKLRALHNQTFGYVAGSRPEYELLIFTDNTAELVRSLSRVQEKHTALSRERTKEYAMEMTA